MTVEWNLIFFCLKFSGIFKEHTRNQNFWKAPLEYFQCSRLADCHYLKIFMQFSFSFTDCHKWWSLPQEVTWDRRYSVSSRIGRRNPYFNWRTDNHGRLNSCIYYFFFLHFIIMKKNNNIELRRQLKLLCI